MHAQARTFSSTEVHLSLHSCLEGQADGWRRHWSRKPASTARCLESSILSPSVGWRPRGVAAPGLKNGASQGSLQPSDLWRGGNGWRRGVPAKDVGLRVLRVRSPPSPLTFLLSPTAYGESRPFGPRNRSPSPGRLGGPRAFWHACNSSPAGRARMVGWQTWATAEAVPGAASRACTSRCARGGWPLACGGRLRRDDQDSPRKLGTRRCGRGCAKARSGSLRILQVGLHTPDDTGSQTRK